MSPLSSPRDALDRARECTSMKELDRLAQSSWDFVRVAVAANPNTSPETLARLFPSNAAEWSNQDMIISLAGNPGTSAEVLANCSRLLAGLLDGGRHQNAFRAGICLAMNSRTPFDALVEMLSAPHTSTEFRKVVARETGRSDLLELLSKDSSPRVRNAALRRLKSGQ